MSTAACSTLSDEFSEFLRVLYTARETHQLLATYVESVGRLVRTPFPAVYLLDPERDSPIYVYSRGVPDKFLRAYERTGRRIDPLLFHISKYRRPTHDAELFTEREWHSHDFSSVRRLAPMERIMEAPLLHDGRLVGTLNFSRMDSRDKFTKDDLRVAKWLSAHFSVALANVGMFEMLTSQSRLARSALQALSAGLIMMDTSGRVHFAYGLGRKLLDLCDRNPALGSVLRATLDAGQSISERGDAEVVKVVRLPPHVLERDPYLLVRSVRLMDDSDIVAHFLHRPETNPDFRHLRGTLTAQEIRVLELVAQGLSYKDVATCLVVGIETVKTHIKHMFLKMGVNSRAQLVRKASHGAKASR